jgi:hypothetical protein
LRSSVQTISKSFRAGVAEIVTSFLCQWSVNAVAFLYMSRQHCFVAVNQPVPAQKPIRSGNRFADGDRD